MRGALLVGLWGLASLAGCRGGEDPHQLAVSGTVEAVTAEVAFKQPGRVAARPVAEGDTVEAGQLLATLDDTGFRQDVAQRAADLRAARAALQDLQDGARPAELAQASANALRARAAFQEVRAGARASELEAARQAAGRARIQAEQLERQALRVERLYAVGGLSAQERDAQRSAADAARATANEAAARLRQLAEGARHEDLAQAGAVARQADAALALMRAGPRPGQLEQARARVDLADASWQAARTREADARLLAPFGGVVLAQHVEPGEVVAAGTPVVSLARLASTYVEAFVPETDVARLKLGAAASVAVDGLAGRRFAGKLSYLSARAEFTPKSVQTTQERVKLVYRIKVDVPNPDLTLKPGMPADVTLRLADAR